MIRKEENVAEYFNRAEHEAGDTDLVMQTLQMKRLRKILSPERWKVRAFSFYQVSCLSM